MERGVRAAIVKATTDLNRVDYRALNTDARNQYDTAKRFIVQADDKHPHEESRLCEEPGR